MHTSATLDAEGSGVVVSQGSGAVVVGQWWWGSGGGAVVPSRLKGTLTVTVTGTVTGTVTAHRQGDARLQKGCATSDPFRWHLLLLSKPAPLLPEFSSLGL